MYYHARYYDPQLGRFISPDSIVPGAANPQSLNRYSYVLNNPINLTDPTGHCDSKDHVACNETVDAITHHSNFHTSAIAGLTSLKLGELLDLLKWLDLGVMIGGAGWTVGAIDAVRQGLDRVYNHIFAMGKGHFNGDTVLNAISRALGLAGGLLFEMVSGLGVPGKVEPQSFGNTILLDQARYTNGATNESTLIDGVVHEMGHIVDWHLNGATLSNNGDGYFWSTQRGNDWVTSLGWSPGCSGTAKYECVIDRHAASTYAFNQNSGEDFAESFALVVSGNATGEPVPDIYMPFSTARGTLVDNELASFLPGHVRGSLP